MTETTLIAVPCRVITLRVELGDDSGASTLESLVLEAVDGGRRTVAELGRLFSLPHRLMLDVVHGLWSRGFLAVDFSTHSLRSTARADQAAPRGEDGQQSLASSVRQRRFLFDPVTATVLPYEQGRSRVPHGALEMPLARGISEDDLPQTELLRAVRHAVDSDGRRRSAHHRVLNVSFANPVLSPPHAVRWRTVETVVKRDPASGLVAAVPVSPPPGWGRRALELFQARITDLVRSRPESRFVRLLTERQIPEGHSPQSLRSQLLELEGLARELTRAPDERVPALHDELTGRALRVREEVAEARRARCSAQSVAAGAGVDWVVHDLVESANRQLVLAVPEITYDALHPVLPRLELAAKRGVTLVFLWGSHPYAKLEARVATALFDLQARFPQAVLLEQRSSGSAASVVVCDDRAAFVGSRSVLSGDAGSGVLVGPADGEDGPPECVSELLGWARRTYPYWETGRGIALAPADFGRREGAAEGGRPQRPRLPELEERWDEDPAAYRTGWAAAWGRVLRGLAADVDDVHRGAPVVRVAWDGMYVELAQRLMSGAAERLALADDTADPDGAEEQLAERLSGLRGKGVVVHLQHPPSSEARRREGAYAELLRRLATERTLRATRARARAVLSDHELVVGSHHPLGGGSTGPARGRPPGELGLHIVGTAFTADFARELGIPDWYGGGGSAEPPVYLPPLPALDAAPVRDDPWAVLDSRREREEPPEVLRREAAGLLLGGTPGERERRTWARWLADDAWARGRSWRRCCSRRCSAGRRGPGPTWPPRPSRSSTGRWATGSTPVRWNWPRPPPSTGRSPWWGPWRRC
ncbi:hypothetical protein ACRAR1_04730 [Streptomyces sanyensis]|uniref:hypothetical protein n=1 Tax=Streptomyces sanyensis TaxID=568869 RepID=UPI003D77EDE7